MEVSPFCLLSKTELGVKLRPKLKHLGFRPFADMCTEGFRIRHLHGFADANGHVDVLGAKMMKRVRNEPSLVHPCNVGVTVFQGHGNDWEPFFSTGVEHARAIFQQLGSFECRALGEDDNAHALLQAVFNGGTRRASAVFAFSVDPNGAEQRRTPADDGPRFGLDTADIHHWESYWEQDCIDVGTVVAHQDCRLLGELAVPLNANAHDALNLPDEGDKASVDVRAFGFNLSSNQTHHREGQKKPCDGDQRQQQKQHDSNEGSDGAHGGDWGPKVRSTAVQEASNKLRYGEGACGTKVPGRARFIFLAGVTRTVNGCPVVGWVQAKCVQVKWSPCPV